MELGIILHKVQNSNIFIVDVGWGQLRYFASNRHYKVGDYVLYEVDLFWEEEADDRLYEIYETKEDWLKGEEASKRHYDSNRIKVICRFDECDYQGNIRFDAYRPSPSESDIVIARRDLFVYWKSYNYAGQVSWSSMRSFDKISNSLLFLSYAEPRYPLPGEKVFLKAYSDARKKVEELDIPKMIEELKVEVYNNDWTRRGSDNVSFGHTGMRYNYSYHYDYLHDHYLDSIFPKYSESLYSSKDGECEYIHPKYENTIINRKPDGSIEFRKAKFDGIDIDDYCANKTKELRQVALENYKKYNKDEHINSLAYSDIYWSTIYNYKEENELILKMKGLAEVVWGFKHQELIEQITLDNYQKLIQNNNSNHPIPQLPDEE